MGTGHAELMRWDETGWDGETVLVFGKIVKMGLDLEC